MRSYSRSYTRTLPRRSFRRGLGHSVAEGASPPYSSRRLALPVCIARRLRGWPLKHSTSSCCPLPVGSAAGGARPCSCSWKRGGAATSICSAAHLPVAVARSGSADGGQHLAPTSLTRLSMRRGAPAGGEGGKLLDWQEGPRRRACAPPNKGGHALAAEAHEVARLALQRAHVLLQLFLHAEGRGAGRGPGGHGSHAARYHVHEDTRVSPGRGGSRMHMMRSASRRCACPTSG